MKIVMKKKKLLCCTGFNLSKLKLPLKFDIKCPINSVLVLDFLKFCIEKNTSVIGFLVNSFMKNMFYI